MAAGAAGLLQPLAGSPAQAEGEATLSSRLPRRQVHILERYAVRLTSRFPSGYS
jgi:hypothetical protein